MLRSHARRFVPGVYDCQLLKATLAEEAIT
jgi:hypothetical protein